MSGILKTMVGRKVSVFTMGQGTIRDDGVIRNVDDQCLVLEKGQDTLVFVVANIRLIKVIE